MDWQLDYRNLFHPQRFCDSTMHRKALPHRSLSTARPGAQLLAAGGAKGAPSCRDPSWRERWAPPPALLCRALPALLARRPAGGAAPHNPLRADVCHGSDGRWRRLSLPYPTHAPPSRVLTRSSGAGHVVHPRAVTFGGRYGGREGFLGNSGHARAIWRPGSGLPFVRRPTAQPRGRPSGLGVGAALRALSLGSRGSQQGAFCVTSFPNLLF